MALGLKIRLFNTIVTPTALYACETWKSTKTICRRLNVFQQRCLRRILRVSYLDRITNAEIHRRTSTRPFSEMVAERRFCFAGHVLHLPPQRLARTSIDWIPRGGKRKQGGQSKTWRRTFHDDLKALDIGPDEIEEMATDRIHWRTLVALCAERRGRI